MQLPEDFVRYTRYLMGDERFERFMQAFDEQPPASIRLNPLKTKGMTVPRGEPVPWCREGYYLPQRPNFTMDPLLHAGCYYVQEAASMFVTHIIHGLLTPPPCSRRFSVGSLFPPSPLHALDLCAAPGGKSTAMIAALPEGSVLYSNEPVRQRASILLENITKWGYPNCIVTNSYPRDYRASKLKFDLILCDVPCSGEGMFRRDEATIREWSPQNVERCWRLQREIVSDAWACLNDGGILIYSTCTFNTHENEENVRWACEELGVEVLPVETQPEWNITGSLLPGFDAPVYRFIPGITRSEGLFICVLHKKGICRKSEKRSVPTLKVISTQQSPSSTTHQHPSPLTYSQAIAYLRGEALTLPPDTPRGIVDVCFMGHPLGTVKNIGTRANNLYPKEWRIRTTYVPTDYEAVIR